MSTVPNQLMILILQDDYKTFNSFIKSMFIDDSQIDVIINFAATQRIKYFRRCFSAAHDMDWPWAYRLLYIAAAAGRKKNVKLLLSEFGFANHELDPVRQISTGKVSKYLDKVMARHGAMKCKDI